MHTHTYTHVHTHQYTPRHLALVRAWRVAGLHIVNLDHFPLFAWKFTSTRAAFMGIWPLYKWEGVLLRRTTTDTMDHTVGKLHVRSHSCMEYLEEAHTCTCATKRKSVRINIYQNIRIPYLNIDSDNTTSPFLHWWHMYAVVFICHANTCKYVFINVCMYACMHACEHVSM